MKKLSLFVVLSAVYLLPAIAFGSVQASENTFDVSRDWDGDLPFKYEMSWKLSNYMHSEVFLLNNTEERCEIGAIGAHEYGEVCYEVDLNMYECEKDANGVQGEYDYSCRAKILVLNNEVREKLLVNFDMFSIDGNLEISIKDVF